MDRSEQDADRAGRSRLTWLFLGVAALLVLGGIVLRATAPDPESLPPAEYRAQALETFVVKQRPVVAKAQIAGLLEPSRRVDLFAEVGGRVLELGAEELARVEAGQLLVRLDPLSAEVAVARADAAMQRADSEGTLSAAELERNRGLADRNAASRAALDRAENASRMATAAKLEAGAALAEARDQLAKKTVRAPFEGVLRAFPVEVGEYVQPGERIAELLDVDVLRVTIGLTDREVVAVRPGAAATLWVDALPGESFTGEVKQVGGAIDLANRKFPIRIELPNPDARLLPGMVARVEIELGDTESMLAVPRDAVSDEFGLRHVYVVEPGPDGGFLAIKRRVDARLIPFRPTEMRIDAGLAPGERIAISALRQLRDGMPVEPLPSVELGGLTRQEQP